LSIYCVRYSELRYTKEDEGAVRVIVGVKTQLKGKVSGLRQMMWCLYLFVPSKVRTPIGAQLPHQARGPFSGQATVDDEELKMAGS
jgi:hypothetical protein